MFSCVRLSFSMRFCWSVSIMSSVTWFYVQIQEDELKEAVILVFANKQDLPNAMTVSELTDKLGLQSLHSRTVRTHTHFISTISVMAWLRFHSSEPCRGGFLFKMQPIRMIRANMVLNDITPTMRGIGRTDLHVYDSVLLSTDRTREDVWFCNWIEHTLLWFCQ